MSYPRLEIVRGGRHPAKCQHPMHDDDCEFGCEMPADDDLESTDLFSRPSFGLRLLMGATCLLFALLVLGYVYYRLSQADAIQPVAGPEARWP